MATITKILVEPSNELTINQNFVVKVLVDDYYLLAKKFATENDINIIAENGDYIRTEFGYE